MPIRRKVIEFTWPDLRRGYENAYGCTIFAAFDRAGVPVSRVNWDNWEDEGVGALRTRPWDSIGRVRKSCAPNALRETGTAGSRKSPPLECSWIRMVFCGPKKK